MRLLLTLAMMVTMMTMPASSAPPIKIVAASAAGSGSDIVARITAEFLAKKTGRQIVVENRPGAAGSLAATNVAQSDANVLLFGSSVLATRLSWPIVKDLKPVSAVASTPLVLVAAAKYASFADMIAAGKDHSLNFGAPGYGTPSHYASVLLGRDNGLLPQTLIPFRGSPEALGEVVAGRLDYIYIPSNVAQGMNVSIFSDVIFNDWFLMFAPAHVDVTEISAALASVTTDPEFQQRITALGGVALTWSIEQLVLTITQRAELYQSLILAP